MNITSLKIDGLLLIEPKIHQDDRGYFFESYRSDLLENILPNHSIWQENQSESKYGVARGLHYQLEPYAQSKLVRVIKGKVLDIIVDLRYSSKTYGMTYSIEIDSSTHQQLFIPKGCAHGFITLSTEAIFLYKTDNPYSPHHERGLNIFDNTLKINLNVINTKLIVNKKDELNPLFENCEKFG